MSNYIAVAIFSQVQQVYNTCSVAICAILYSVFNIVQQATLYSCHYGCTKWQHDSPKFANSYHIVQLFRGGE